MSADTDLLRKALTSLVRFVVNSTYNLLHNRGTTNLEQVAQRNRNACNKSTPQHVKISWTWCDEKTVPYNKFTTNLQHSNRTGWSLSEMKLLLLYSWTVLAAEDDSPCDHHKCDYGAVCTVNGPTAVCVCPTDCPDHFEPVRACIMSN